MIRRSMTVFALALVAAALIAAPAFAQGPSRTYEVTITNTSYAQIISPPVIVVHSPELSLFTAGQPALEEVAAIAEDANSAPLLELLDGLDGVYGVATGDGVIMPGASATIEVTANGRVGVISAVAMLVTTNDAFMGFRRPERSFVRIDGGAEDSFQAIAYDAGSEANTESCDHIPGPPCGNGGVRVTDGAEGFVHVHRGIHGGESLDPATHDWRNPVANVTIDRKRGNERGSRFRR